MFASRYGKKKKVCVYISIYFSISYNVLQWKFAKNIFVFFLLSTVYIPDPRAPPTPFLQFLPAPGRKGVLTSVKAAAFKAPCLTWLQPFAKHGADASGASQSGRQRGFQKATRHQVTSKKMFLLSNHPWNGNKGAPQQPAASWAWWRCVCEAGREEKA